MPEVVLIFDYIKLKLKEKKGIGLALKKLSLEQNKKINNSNVLR